jgi:membrane protease YdiL (CAAX protease family)
LILDDLLASPPSSGFQNAVLVYIAAAFLSFAAAASIFFRRRRQAGRHAWCALLLALFVAAMQMVVVLSLRRIPDTDFERNYFRDTMYATALILLPAFFISAFFMTASGAFLAERADIPPFPISRAFAASDPRRGRLFVESLFLALLAAAVAVAWSILLFKATERFTGAPPQPAPGTEDVAFIFTGRTALVLGFGLAAAFWEEIFVRLFLQNALIRLFRNARGGTGCAVVVASAVWAAGHAGTVQPELVKFLQVFGVGIMLGIVNLRRGIEPCLVAHSAFNVGILVIGGFQ